jgi:lysophospholipase L1-like esterase
VKSFTKTSRLLVGAVATVTFAALAIAPASAAPARDNVNAGQPVQYVALGDSYAYGVGADHVTESYPALLDARADIRLTANVTKSGATTSDVINDQLPNASTALKNAGLVTLTVGGNDLHVADIASTCALLGPTSTPCLTAVATAQNMLTSGELFSSLRGTLKAVRASAPHAQIVVTGYPLLFDPSFSAFGPLAQQINAAAVALNITIRAAVLVSQTPGRNLGFASVVVPFLGHGIGSADPWFHLGDAASFHPTATGYRKGYFPAVALVVASAPLLTAKAA